MAESTFDELALLELHARALFTYDARSRMQLVNEPNGSRRAPRFYLGRSARGNVWRFRDDLAGRLVAELDALCRAEATLGVPTRDPCHRNAYLELLNAAGAEPWSGPAYRFSTFVPPSRPVTAIREGNRELLRGGFDAWLGDVADWQPFVALVVEGHAVAICASVRITPHVHAAGVETLTPFRGRGYARDVVRAWAERVAALRALPFYSTSWSNEASMGVARSLGLVQYGVDFHVG